MIDINVKQHYLDSQPDHAFNRIHDAIVEALDLDYKTAMITTDHIKQVLMLITDEDFADGMAWSFGDTVVGDSIYTFIMENQEVVRAVLNK